MAKRATFTAVALCPELDVVSQGKTAELAVASLKEAVELSLEFACPSEVKRRAHSEVFTTRLNRGVQHLEQWRREVRTRESASRPARLNPWLWAGSALG